MNKTNKEKSSNIKKNKKVNKSMNLSKSLGSFNLFEEDNMGQYAINYVYIYDAHESFSSLIQSPENVYQIYLAIRTKFQESKISSSLSL